MPDLQPLNPAPPARRRATDNRGRDARGAMIALQERLLERALEAGASDLHIEPFPQRTQLRVRIDGYLSELDSLPCWMHAGLVSRFKILATMDVTERRRPQDGRCVFSPPGGEPVDLRVATAATQHGEKVTVRLLPRSRRPPDLEDLGLDRERLRRVDAMARQPHGLILAAGPTGAGKSTTLHALLRRIDAVGRSIVTLEDPIEYTLEGASQIPVRPAIGVDFATALRSVLRHDPDVVLVGEVRDEETAAIALRAATTGHLVLSSVHTNNAAESVIRLFELGVPPYLVAAGIVGVTSQRLVRKLCRRCRVPHAASAGDLEASGLGLADQQRRMFTALGCSACRGGYRGRIGIFETLTMEPVMRRAVSAGGGSAAVEETAREHGALLTLRGAAREALFQGETSVDEIARVVGPGPVAHPNRASCSSGLSERASSSES